MSVIETVTVLFFDRVGSTEWRSVLGDDAADALQREFDATTRAAIERTGGHVVKHTGDGFMAVFTAAASGVQAGVDIQRATARFRRPGAGTFGLRVGISAGDVGRDGDDAFGTPVVEAARLCAAAGTGEILVAEVARSLVGSRGGFTFTASRPFELKGLPGPLMAHGVTWAEDGAAAVPLPAPLATSHPTPMIGRADPLDRLAEAFAGTPTTGRRLVLVAGEPGVGKTRLVSELAGWAHGRGAAVFLGRCDDAVPSPMRPIIEFVRHALDHVPAGRLALLGDWHRAALDRLVVTGGGTEEAVDPLVETHTRHEALDALLAIIAESGPVLVVLDDLHWADAASVIELRHLASTPQDAPVLVVGTYRETDLDRRHPFAACLADLRRLPDPPTRILLSGLDRRGTSELVAAWAGDEVPEPFVDAVFAETEGNPFFCQEVLRHLAETGAAFRDEDGTWTTARAIAQLGIPPGVRETVGRRLAQLDAGTIDLLTVAAVLGREFGLDLLVAVTDRHLDDVLDALDPALIAGLVEETDRFGLLRFAHALVRSTLYEELPTTRRVRLHQRVAHALEASHSDPADVIEALAHHYGEAAVAGEWHAAIRYHVLAAEVAESRTAPISIAGHYRAALDLFDASGIEDDAMQFELLVRLGWALVGGSDPHAAEQHVRRALEVAHRLEDLDALAWAARPVGHLMEHGTPNLEILSIVEGILAELPDRPSAARASMSALQVSIMTATVADRHSVDRIRRQAKDALAMADRVAAQGVDAQQSVFDGASALFGPPSTVVALMAVHNSLQDGPDLATAQAVTDRMIEESGRTNQRQWLANSLLRQAIVRWQLGDRAAMNATHAQIDSSGIDIPSIRGLWLRQRAGLAIGDGDFDHARALLEELRATVPGNLSAVMGYHAARWVIRLEEARVDLDTLESLAEASRFAWIEVLPALVRAERGDLDGAAAVLDRFRKRDDLGIPYNNGQPPTLRVLSEVTAHLGDTEFAEALTPYVDPYESQMFVGFAGAFSDGAADRALGQLALVRGDLDEAVSRLESGLALEQGFGAHALAARTRLWLGRALRTRAADGDLERAGELERPATV